MRPIVAREGVDRNPGLPKFLWFDDGDGGDSGPGGDASATGGGTGATTGVGSGAAPGTSTTTSGGAAPGTGGVTGGGDAAANAAAADAVGGTASFGGQSFGGQAAPAAPSATGFGVSVTGSPGSTTAPGGAAPGGTAGTAGSGGAGGATGPGAATGGAGGVSTSAVGHSGVTGGGGGTASGGAGFGGVQGMNPSVVTALIRAGLMGVPRGLLTGVQTATAPVTVSPLSDLSGLAQTHAATLGGRGGIGSDAVAGGTAQSGPGTTQTTSIGPGEGPPGTMGFPAIGVRAGAPGTMGFPAAALAHTPTGGYTSSLGAPSGSTVGQATINAPATNPDAPAPGSHNADGLAAAAQTAQAQTNSTTGAPTATTPAQVAAQAVDMGPLFNLILSLVMGGSGGPQLSNLARTATMGG